MFKEKDGYRIGLLPYPAIPKVNDNNTLLNFNVQKDGNDVTNTFISLIIKDKNSDRIVHQVPYKFYEFADSSYSYTFQNHSQYSLSLLTKIAGDPKYENNPLIVSFDIEISNYNRGTFSYYTILCNFLSNNNYFCSQFQKTDIWIFSTGLYKEINAKNIILDLTYC